MLCREIRNRNASYSYLPNCEPTFRMKNRDGGEKFALQETFKKHRTKQWQPTIYARARSTNQP